MSEKLTAYITKHVFTVGIEAKWGEVDAEFPTMFRSLAEGDKWAPYYHGRDWHRTREDAVKRAEEMRTKKIASLEKQIAAYRKLRFE